MKYNRSQFFALAGMRKKNDNAMRTEQKNIIKIIKKFAIRGQHWYMEPEMKCLFLADDAGPMEVQRQPQLDIYISHKMRKNSPPILLAIRIQGQYHDRPNQEKYDDWQKSLLKANGYTVIDLWYHAMPYCWEHKKSSNMEKKQYEEVYFQLSDVLQFEEYEKID